MKKTDEKKHADKVKKMTEEELKKVTGGKFLADLPRMPDKPIDERATEDA